MKKIPYPQSVNLSKFETGSKNSNAFYGLPSDIGFCQSCVISNQRPNSAVEFKHTRESKKKTINFDDEGVCDACRLGEKKKSEIDWATREKELRALCDAHRRDDGHYDCLVPGSGGKDSFFAAHKLKYEYGMHPLTVTWAPHLYTEWGWRNQQAWIHAGFDNVLVTPNGMVHRLLTRLAVENLFHPFQPFILGQKNLAPKMALRFDIPLVFFGENEAEYGNPIDDSAGAQRGTEYFTGTDDADAMFLGGVSLRNLVDDFGVEKYDLNFYIPEDPVKLEEKKLEVHYLGYYLNWHPQSCYYYAVEHGNFEASPERTPGTYSKYNSIDDKIDDLHYYTTFIKFGIGRATYDAAQEIRSADIDRDEGVALVKRFDGEFPERFIDELFSYLSISADKFPIASQRFEQPVMDRAYFDALTDQFRSPHLWQWNGTDWSLRHTVWQGA
ncbi:MAG: N-acetyl sugar amidotransferase [Alphaproteobacteria bacterium]|nr:N-acetyl sugar amidotransferase [Alphaproteobacteria bacterium]